VVRAERVTPAHLLRVASIAALTLLTACAASAPLSPPQDRCAGRASFEETAAVLAACLPAGASASDASRMLATWQRTDGEWGGVTEADVLPGGGPELLANFHADLKEAAWNPQGKFVVLQALGPGSRSAEGGAWRVAFELDAGRLGIRDVNGAPWTNWSYHILDTADLTGDGLDDVVMELRYSNGMHVVFRYLALLTAQPAEKSSGIGGPTPNAIGEAGSPTMRVAYLEDTVRTRPAYHLVERGNHTVLESTISVREKSAITRTLAFNGSAFEVAGEEINPTASTVSAETPDGARWYGFDTFDGGGGSSMYDPVLGLYRLGDGQLQHFDMPGTVRALRVGPDGSLYAAGGLGVMRYREGLWETLLNSQGDPALAAAPFAPFDMAFGPNGELWVAGIFSLARFKDGAWTQIVLPARRLLVAPDGSIWTEGWDGRAGSDCCFNHLTGSTWVTYTHSAALPGAPDLQERIRALQR
jgi:hypothetical protein